MNRKLSSQTNSCFLFALSKPIISVQALAIRQITKSSADNLKTYHSSTQLFQSHKAYNTLPSVSIIYIPSVSPQPYGNERETVNFANYLPRQLATLNFPLCSVYLLNIRNGNLQGQFEHLESSCASCIAINLGPDSENPCIC